MSCPITANEVTAEELEWLRLTEAVVGGWVLEWNFEGKARFSMYDLQGLNSLITILKYYTAPQLWRSHCKNVKLIFHQCLTNIFVNPAAPSNITKVFFVPCFD